MVASAIGAEYPLAEDSGAERDFYRLREFMGCDHDTWPPATAAVDSIKQSLPALIVSHRQHTKIDPSTVVKTDDYARVQPA